jgi:hypothetical protein
LKQILQDCHPKARVPETWVETILAHHQQPALPLHLAHHQQFDKIK